MYLAVVRADGNRSDGVTTARHDNYVAGECFGLDRSATTQHAISHRQTRDVIEPIHDIRFHSELGRWSFNRGRRPNDFSVRPMFTGCSPKQLFSYLSIFVTTAFDRISGVERHTRNLCMCVCVDEFDMRTFIFTISIRLCWPRVFSRPLLLMPSLRLYEKNDSIFFGSISPRHFVPYAKKTSTLWPEGLNSSRVSA